MQHHKMWVVGVEHIRPHLKWVTTPLDGPLRVRTEVTGNIIWHTETTAKLGLPPHNTTRSGSDELDLLMRFLRDVKDCGYVVVEQPVSGA